MQTFLPYADYAASAATLDNRRLGKQRVEVLQILNALTNPEAKGWMNHPCSKMWRGHESSLVLYGLAVCQEWRKRGFQDTVLDKLTAQLESLPPSAAPPWLGDERLHASHRSKLLGKDPDHYGQFGWTEPPGLDAYWPV